MPVRTSSSKLISAVAYYRMSSDKQETSIPDQRRAVERYATEHGYVIIREYCDEGISGDATEKRFAFQKMLAECKAGDFKAVLCWDQDRFGRFDPLEAGYWIRPMREAGVHLVTVAQGEVDWEDFAGRIVWSVTQEGKHAYLRDLSRNVTRGLLAKAKLGEWVAGRPPYGYRLKGKHLFPGPADEVAVIVELFDGYIAGMSCRALAVRLNVAGVASPRGKAWAESTIRKALQNVAYIGTASWNGERAGKYNRVVNGQIEKRLDKGRKQNVDEDAILVPGTHPPIVDRKKFDLVQRLLASRKSLTTPVRGGGGFVLTGLLRCGHCGLAMHGTTEGKQRGCDHKVYRCAGSCEHGRGFCQPNRIRQDALLPCIVAKLKGQLQREFTMKASRDRFRKELQSQLKAKAARPDAKRLQQELTELDAKIARLERRVLDVEDDMLPIVTAELRTLRTRRDDARSSLAGSATPDGMTDDQIDAKVEAIMGAASVLVESLSITEPLALRDVIGEMVSEIQLWFTYSPRGKTGKQVRCDFLRGIIHVQPDSEIGRLEAFSNPCNSSLQIPFGVKDMKKTG